MSNKLRPYQEELVRRTKRMLRPGKAPVVVLPTGSGKTEVAIALSEKFERVVVIVPSTVLMSQTAERFEQHGRKAVYGANCWSPDTYWPKDAEIVVVSGVVASRRINWLKKNRPELIIIDEAHHAAMPPDYRITDTNDITTLVRTAREKGVPVLGLTATPCRLEEDMGFEGIFTQLVCGPSYKKLVDDGFLAPLRIVNAREADRIRVGSVGEVKPGYKDYLASEIMQLNTRTRLVDVPSHWLMQETEQFTRKAIVYCVNQRHAADYAGTLAALPNAKVGLLLSSQDYAADTDRRVLYGSKKADREEVVARFADGRLNVLVNVGIAKEGFDCPSAEVVQVLRPTMSRGLWFQMVGRCSRPADGKADAVVLDAPSNSSRLGNPMLHDPKEWTLKSLIRTEELAREMDHLKVENHFLTKENEQLRAAINGSVPSVLAETAVRRIPSKSRSAYCGCEHHSWRAYSDNYQGSKCGCLMKGYGSSKNVPCGCRRRSVDEFLFRDGSNKWRWGKPEKLAEGLTQPDDRPSVRVEILEA